MMRPILIVALLLATAARAEPPLPTRVREVDHLRLRACTLEIQLEDAKRAAARAEADRADRAVQRLAEERRKIVADFEREYQIDASRDHYVDDAASQRYLEIERAKPAEKPSEPVPKPPPKGKKK